MRFYYLTPQWDTTLQASNFLPDQFNPAQRGEALPAGLHRRLPVLGLRPARHGPEAGLARAWRRRLANTVEARFIGRLTPGSNRFNGAFQAGQGINDQLQDGNAFKVSPRFGVTYDITGKGETILRGGFGIFYDRPQGNMVFDMISNAPGRAELDAQLGPAPGPDAGGAAAIPTRRCRSTRRRTTSSRRRRTSGTSASSTSSGRR